MPIKYLLVLKSTSKAIYDMVEQEQVSRCKFLEINCINYLELIFAVIYHPCYYTFVSKPWNPGKIRRFNVRDWDEIPPNYYDKHFENKVSNINELYPNIKFKENSYYYYHSSINVCRTIGTQTPGILSWDTPLFPFNYKHYKILKMKAKGRSWKENEWTIINCEQERKSSEKLELIDFIHGFYLIKDEDNKSDIYHEFLENLTMSFNEEEKSIEIEMKFSYNRDT